MNLIHEEKLTVVERKMLRSIYGPVQDLNNEWREREQIKKWELS